MNILYHSAPPMADTGYGVHTKNLSVRLNEDHDVSIHSVAGFDGMGMDWEGIHVYPPGGGQFGQQSIPYWYRQTDADVVFSHHDHWSMADDFAGMHEAGIPTVLYTILDNDLPGKRPPKSVVRACEGAHKTVVMSEWAESRLHNSRIPNEDVHRVPHGVNTTKYAPVTDRISEARLKRNLGVPEDCFLFGMVAANYGPRKNIPMHLEAFKRLVEEDGAEDAYFYLHTHPTMQDGHDLYAIRDALNLDPDRVLFPDPHEMYHGIEDMVVVQLYNTFDVHCNVTQSESWGLTITEALSCGTPVIAANNSAATEQMNVPYDYRVDRYFDDGFAPVNNGILVDRGVTLWTQGSNARRYISGVDDIYAAMRWAYNHRDEMAERGEQGREYVVENYDWDHVYDAHWQPLFEEVAADLEGEYNDYYMKRRDAETSGEAFRQECEALELRTRGESILDAGCGPGNLAAALDDHDYDVVAVDKSEAAIEYARAENEIPCRVDDIRSLDFESDYVDTAIAQHVLEHVEADAHALAELSRVASQRVLAIVPEGGPNRPSPDPTEKRRYDESELQRLAADFESVTGLEMDYERVRITDSTRNWLITVDVGGGDDD